MAFRVSPEENKQIDAAVRLSGLTKQDYITRRLLDRAVVVQGNPRVYKALRNELAAVCGCRFRLLLSNFRLCFPPTLRFACISCIVGVLLYGMGV